MSDWLEEFWADILSEQPMQVIAAWSTLDGEAKDAVYAHLQRMVTEEGWANVQREAARTALSAIGEYMPGSQMDGGNTDG